MDQVTRRGFLGAILAAGVAPAIVRSTSIMPLWLPRDPTKYVWAQQVALTWPEATSIEVMLDWQAAIREAVASALAVPQRMLFAEWDADDPV
jgi:hypothetical protein